MDIVQLIADISSIYTHAHTPTDTHKYTCAHTHLLTKTNHGIGHFVFFRHCRRPNTVKKNPKQTKLLVINRIKSFSEPKVK